MQDWFRADGSGEQPAHWIKLRASTFLMAACGKILPRNLARRVETQKTALAQAPGQFYEKPDGTVCEDCTKKAIEQA